MSEPMARRSRLLKWLSLLILLAVVGVLGLVFWDALRVLAYVHMLRFRRTSAYAERGLRNMGRDALPHLIRYAAVNSKGRGMARGLVYRHWEALTADEVRATAPWLFHWELLTRPVYAVDRPMTFMVRINSSVPPVPLMVRGELIEGGRVLATSQCELPRRQRRDGVTDDGGGFPLAYPCGTVWIGRFDGGGEPSGQQFTRIIRKPGWHTLRLTPSIDDPRLEEPAPVCRLTRNFETVRELSERDFFPVSNVGLDRKMRGRLDINVDGCLPCVFPIDAVELVAGDCILVRRPALPFVGGRIGTRERLPSFGFRALVAIAETGEERTLDWLGVFWEGEFLSERAYKLSLADFHLEPGRRYRLRVDLRSEPEVAWLDPRVTRYWDGGIAGGWYVQLLEDGTRVKVLREYATP